MRAIILAAGRGSRMGKITASAPKCLVGLKGKTLLERQLDTLRRAGISEIALVTGYKKKLLEPFVKKTFHNALWHTTQMVTSLEVAKDWLEAEECIVSYSDIFYSTSAPLALMKSEYPLAITFDPNWRKLWELRFEDPLSDAETFKIDSDNCVLEIGAKPKDISEIQGQYMGLLKFSPRAWFELSNIRSQMTSEERSRMHMTDAIQRIIECKRIKVQGIPYSDEWGEIDTVSDLKLYT